MFLVRQLPIHSRSVPSADLQPHLFPISPVRQRSPIIIGDSDSDEEPAVLDSEDERDRRQIARLSQAISARQAEREKRSEERKKRKEEAVGQLKPEKGVSLSAKKEWKGKGKEVDVVVVG